ncbi:band 7 domain protein [Acinetobacter lactucae]|nr:band 7 domain protein [Acinetobacter lactucae]
MSDQVVNSALRYRSQAPLIDNLMNELGLQSCDVNGLIQGLKPKA